MHRDFLPKILDTIHWKCIWKECMKWQVLIWRIKIFQIIREKLHFVPNYLTTALMINLLELDQVTAQTASTDTKDLHKICWNRWAAVCNRGPVLVLLHFNKLQFGTKCNLPALFGYYILLLLCLINEDYIIY